MISLETAAGCFNFRAVGVAIQDEQVLLQRAVHDTWWTLPGGRVELHEPSSHALVREMREELGVEVMVLHLLWVYERFYVDEVSLRRHHSLGLYYLMQVPETLFPERFPSFTSPETNDTPLVFHWSPIAQLDALPMPFHPAILRTGLRHVPDSVVHLVDN